VLLMVATGGVWLVDAGYERSCAADEMLGRRAGVCGSRLVDLLRVVCRSVYNKRSADCENRSSQFLAFYASFSRSICSAGADSMGAMKASAVSVKNPWGRRQV